MIEHPNPSKDGRDKCLMITKYPSRQELQDEDTDAEVSFKAFRQRGRYVKEEPEERKSPWWTSANASKRAKKAIDQTLLKGIEAFFALKEKKFDEAL
jgi:hypothetical protein